MRRYYADARSHGARAEALHTGLGDFIPVVAAPGAVERIGVAMSACPGDGGRTLYTIHLGRSGGTLPGYWTLVEGQFLPADPGAGRRLRPDARCSTGSPDYLGRPLSQDYSLRLSQHDWNSPVIQHAWADLIAGSPNPNVLGNSPQFFDHLRRFGDCSGFFLATVRDGVGAIRGVVPLGVTRSGLRFDVAGRVLWEWRAPAIRILGSLPPLPADPAAHDLLFAALDAEFADCAAIAMTSVPTESFLWHYFHRSQSLESRFLVYAIDGVRGCHTIPLPPTVEEYRASLGAKKRYNLNRQVRLLRDRGGGRLEFAASSPHSRSATSYASWTRSEGPPGAVGGADTAPSSSVDGGPRTSPIAGCSWSTCCWEATSPAPSSWGGNTRASSTWNIS